MSGRLFCILVVDDNPNNRFTLQTLLGKLEGCRLLEASSGEEALAVTIEQAIDLILLDVQMPGMDGFETARLLKLTERTRDIPVVFVTAIFRAEEFVRRGYALGAVDYLTKPIDDNLLLNRVTLYRSLFEREQNLKEALEKLQKHEAILIHQSRLAALGQMLGAIAHQWRQPLNALALAIQNLKDAYEYGEFDKEYLDRSVASSCKLIDHMSKTIDDFRHFFKPSQIQECFSPRLAIEETCEIVSAQFKADDILVDIACGNGGAGELLCIGFSSELKQALLNLLDNAKDAIMDRQKEYGKPYQGHIHITLLPFGGGAAITVEDNGGGIPSAHEGRIFEPFYTTKEEGKGTGVGLYMSKMIIEEHMDGKLLAENTQNGARFSIQLPRRCSTLTPAQ